MFIYDLKLQDKYNTCALLKHIGKYVYSDERREKPFPPFLSLIHILPICFDSAQVLYIYFYMYIMFHFIYTCIMHNNDFNKLLC
jgi:hypothetical protein